MRWYNALRRCSDARSQLGGADTDVARSKAAWRSTLAIDPEREHPGPEDRDHSACCLPSHSFHRSDPAHPDGDPKALNEVAGTLGELLEVLASQQTEAA